MNNSVKMVSMESSSEIVITSIGFCGGGEGWMSGIVITSMGCAVVVDLYFLLLLVGNLVEMVGTVV